MRVPLTVMVSYSWDDANAAELLHEELAFRGATVFHDRCTFPVGTRIAPNMTRAAHDCDGFIAYFTPSSLYELQPPGLPRPVIDEEFIPVMERVAQSRAPGGSPAPVILPITHQLGDPRGEALERVRRATGRDISSLWTPVTLDQTTTSITQHEAAAACSGLVAALIERAMKRSKTDPVDLLVVTRGSGQPATFLTVDATRSLGGPTPRPGDSADWKRLLAGIKDLEQCLAASTRERRLNLTVRAHLTAALIVGRVFHQAAGWRLTVAGRGGDARLASDVNEQILQVSFDRGALGGDLAIEIDLLGVEVGKVAASVLAASVPPITSRLVMWREGRADIAPDEIGSAARAAGSAIRAAVFESRPNTVHIFCASPAEFAVLVGHQLTSLHTTLQLYERDGERYVPSIRLD